MSYLEEYFAKLGLEGVELTEGQKRWYAKKFELLGEDVLREYPSTPQEAFHASQEGYWYSIQMKELYDKGQITQVSYDRALPVHCAWDLGQADETAIWFFQILRSGDLNFIDYFQRSNTRLDSLVSILKEKGYVYGSHIWPHDANARDKAGITFIQQVRNFNLNGIVLEMHLLRDGINIVRSTLSKCWFDSKRCKEGLNCLEGYKRKWSNQIGGFTNEPVHDIYSHGADAFRYACAGYKRLSDYKGLEGDYKALRAYWGG